MRTKMLTLRIPAEAYQYLDLVAKKQGSTVQNVSQILLMTCVQGMVKKDKEELERLKKEAESQTEKEEGEGFMSGE